MTAQLAHTIAGVLAGALLLPFGVALFALALRVATEAGR